MQNTRTYVVVMSKISVKMPHLLLAITSANFVIFLVSDNSTSWRGKRLHFPDINGTASNDQFHDTGLAACPAAVNNQQ